MDQCRNYDRQDDGLSATKVVQNFVSEVLYISTGYINQIDQSCSSLISEYKEGSVEMKGVLKNVLSVVLADLFVLLPTLRYKLWVGYNLFFADIITHNCREGFTRYLLQEGFF